MVPKKWKSSARRKASHTARYRCPGRRKTAPPGGGGAATASAGGAVGSAAARCWGASAMGSLGSGREKRRAPQGASPAPAAGAGKRRGAHPRRVDPWSPMAPPRSPLRLAQDARDLAGDHPRVHRLREDPLSPRRGRDLGHVARHRGGEEEHGDRGGARVRPEGAAHREARSESTRLNSSHTVISYAVF